MWWWAGRRHSKGRSMGVAVAAELDAATSQTCQIRLSHHLKDLLWSTSTHTHHRNVLPGWLFCCHVMSCNSLVLLPLSLLTPVERLDVGWVHLQHPAGLLDSLRPVSLLEGSSSKVEGGSLLHLLGLRSSRGRGGRAVYSSTQQSVQQYTADVHVPVCVSKQTRHNTHHVFCR